MHNNYCIVIRLWHAFQQSEQPEGISKVILIGGATAKSEKAMVEKNIGLKNKNIPIHTFYMHDGAKENFEEIARETSGHYKQLDIYSTEGAELLTHFVTKEVLRKFRILTSCPTQVGEGEGEGEGVRVWGEGVG
ncbi:hypothetical protein I4U23_017146 [Adineta vaga]|nr:hypothetical protein I4U23_017146 [Adineta vaga]